MGIANFFYHIWDTFVFIRDNGWEEYKLARKRYDNHQKALDNRDSKYSKVKAIKMANLAKKARK